MSICVSWPSPSFESIVPDYTLTRARAAILTFQDSREKSAEFEPSFDLKITASG
jgi:hypothetical protein